MSSVASLGLTASAYDICDVNHDGSVSLADVTAVSRYLSGNLRVPDYNRLDANKSLTIDYMDRQCVLARTMSWSYSSLYYSKKNKTTSTAPTGVSFTAVADNVVTSSREYRRYSYTNKKELASYKLQVPSDTLSSVNSSNGMARVIIGSDDRYESKGSENSGIVFLTMNGQYGGTGFIVGDHQIATAAHNVYSTVNDNYWFSSMKVTACKYSGELSDTEFTPVEAHIPQKFQPSDDRTQYDYALITVKEDLSGYVHFNLGTSYSVNQSNFANIPIYVTGSPNKTTTGSYNTTNRLYTGEGRVISKNIYGTIPLTNNGVLYYDTDVDQGNSGSPVYTVTKNVINNQSSYTYTAIAIHDAMGRNSDYNCGSLINKYHFQFYNNNPYMSY